MASKISHSQAILIRKAPRQRRSQSTVDSIKQAALELITEHGFSETNTVRIAERAGVSIGSLYQYFSNREAILLAIFEDTSARLAKTMNDFMIDMHSQPLTEAVPEAITRMLTFYRKHELVMLQLVNEVPEMRLSAHPASFDVRVRSTLRVYLEQQNMNRHADETERKVFVLEQIILGCIRRYIREQPRRISSRELVNDIAGIVIRFIQDKSA